MTGQPPPDIADILAAVREGRIGAASAVAWLEQRQADQRRQARQVRAHATPAMRAGLVRAVDSALAGDDDEFARLFPPSAPLGGHQEYPSHPLIYPGEEQGQRDRQPRTAYAAAAPLSDDELYERLFGPAGDEPGTGDTPDYRKLFGDG